MANFPFILENAIATDKVIALSKVKAITALKFNQQDWRSLLLFFRYIT